MDGPFSKMCLLIFNQSLYQGFILHCEALSFRVGQLINICESYFKKSQNSVCDRKEYILQIKRAKRHWCYYSRSNFLVTRYSLKKYNPTATTKFITVVTKYVGVYDENMDVCIALLFEVIIFTLRGSVTTHVTILTTMLIKN